MKAKRTLVVSFVSLVVAVPALAVVSATRTTRLEDALKGAGFVQAGAEWRRRDATITVRGGVVQQVTFPRLEGNIVCNDFSPRTPGSFYPVFVANMATVPTTAIQAICK